MNTFRTTSGYLGLDFLSNNVVVSKLFELRLKDKTIDSATDCRLVSMELFFANIGRCLSLLTLAKYFT